ncbi:hypothetical protein D3C77_673610 [compost metagenome]
MNRLMANERILGGYRSETMDTEGAMPPASPTATLMRASSMCQYWVAMPQAAVARLQIPQHRATMLRRLRVSARRPTGTPSMA